MSIPDLPDMQTILSKTESHYRKLSDVDSNLSCGNNLDLISLKPGDRVLDLGCGNGTETLQVAKLVGVTGWAVGLDLTTEMIQQAMKAAERAKIGNVHFAIGDIEQLPFGNESFTLVISNCVINHARNKNKVYREIFRVLQPGGRFMVSDAVSKRPLPDYIKEDALAWASCFGGAVTEREYLHIIRRAGFNELEIPKRREYVKNGFEFISLTIRATKRRHRETG